MNKFLFILFVGVVSSHLYAQKVIENPEYGLATYPGEITKIEMLDTTTVLHFKLKKLPWGYFHLHEESYIQDLSGDKKLFTIKLTGAEFKRNYFPKSGEVTYQLYFPPLSKTVKTIEFGVEKKGGGGIYDIIIQEDENSVLLPKELRGNWFLVDGSNRWDYGFNSKYAIVDGIVWNYKSVDQKGKKYTITLEKGGEVKTINAKLGKNGMVAFGGSPKSLQDYSLEKVFNPDFKLPNDVAFENVEFEISTATYSGMIKGFSKRMKQKTGMIHVNNPFLGGQESHLVKVSEDGSFKLELPLTHPQTVYVKTPIGRYDVFLEPNKEAFHYIHNRDSYFMGDNAQINADLQKLKDITLSLSKKQYKKIGETSPKDYKKLCQELKEESLGKLRLFQKDNFISKKALQIKNTEIELGFYDMLLSYDMYRRSMASKNKRAKNEKDKVPYKEFEVDEDYYSFLPKSIADNKLLTLSNSYYFFTNRLMYAEIFREDRLSQLNRAEMAYWLQKKGIELTTEELNMVESSKQIETPEIRAKEEKFRKAHGDTEQAFYKKYRKHFKDVRKFIKEKDQYKHHFILNVVDYLKTKNIEITDEEAKMVEALAVLKTPIEIEEERVFKKQFEGAVKTFYDKYNKHSSEIFRVRLSEARDKKMRAFFGKQNSFLQDVMKIQTLSKKFEDYKVYNNETLVKAQEKIHTPFLKEYLAFCNEQTKEKMELNKTKGGYTVHSVEKSEGDELFASMLEKFKGKVVYVDFWATWCAPCKSGIKRIAPLKAEMADEDVVFLYITNQTSPEGTWKNAIANIKGEHYRVSEDEWNYLAEKFNISGIPHYTLVNKEGNIVKPKMPHMDNTSLKRIFKAEMAK
ncbi:TlpA family protein disulfide reductase [Hyunsoonleella sp. SJ7]|uniref:TlpA family protein disulfide reductase n=1 Tax=Hyunsoonleella aquatilis TaxID=2762758 RepID=A0A923HA60_9FLAO|nr:TlpA disulfide reductase family protein [Hyunsoonleella aquatilis]MBC3757902.1 TlpA family protein disulfide reductase [Hyunsoonleella aquatilis]